MVLNVCVRGTENTHALILHLLSENEANNTHTHEYKTTLTEATETFFGWRRRRWVDTRTPPPHAQTSYGL